MLKKSLLAFLAACSMQTSVAYAHADHGKPQYGGVVAEAGMAQLEVVSKDGKVTVYATQHGQALDTTGTSGKLTILANGQKSEAQLQASGANTLSTNATIPKGAKLLLQIQMPNEKPLQARVVMP